MILFRYYLLLRQSIFTLIPFRFFSLSHYICLFAYYYYYYLYYYILTLSSFRAMIFDHCDLRCIDSIRILLLWWTIDLSLSPFLRINEIYVLKMKSIPINTATKLEHSYLLLSFDAFIVISVDLLIVAVCVPLFLFFDCLHWLMLTLRTEWSTIYWFKKSNYKINADQ